MTKKYYYDTIIINDYFIDDLEVETNREAKSSGAEDTLPPKCMTLHKICTLLQQVRRSMTERQNSSGDMSGLQYRLLTLAQVQKKGTTRSHKVQSFLTGQD